MAYDLLIGRIGTRRIHTVSIEDYLVLDSKREEIVSDALMMEYPQANLTFKFNADRGIIGIFKKDGKKETLILDSDELKGIDARNARNLKHEIVSRLNELDLRRNYWSESFSENDISIIKDRRDSGYYNQILE